MTKESAANQPRNSTGTTDPGAWRVGPLAETRGTLERSAPKADPVAELTAQVQELNTRVENIRARQDLKDLTAEVVRRHPDAVTFSLGTYSKSLILVTGAKDKEGNTIAGSEGIQHEIFDNTFPALGRPVETYSDLFSEKYVSSHPGQGNGMSVSCTTVGADVMTGVEEPEFLHPFRLTRLLEIATREARKSEVHAAFDRLEAMRGTFPQGVAELRLTPRVGASSNYTDFQYRDADGNLTFDPDVQRVTGIIATMTSGDLFEIHDRLNYVDDKYSDGYYSIPLI